MKVSAWLFWIAGITLLVPLPGSAQTNAPRPVEIPECQLEAVFLLNFARFVDWPEGALGKPDAPVVVGIYNIEPFKAAFEALERKRAKGRPLVVRQGQTTAELDGCHIVFLNTGDDLLIKRLLQHFRGRPVLTVGEREGFTRWGGIVNFKLAASHVRLQINRDAAKQSGLQLSAQLLEVSELVDGGKP